ncbi:MAG: MFS transporter [Actinomycetota bacterium]|nr:MFS transporter [Actinomycetota bacterium]
MTRRPGPQPSRTSTGRRPRPTLLLAPATFFEGYDTFVLALALPLIRKDFHLTVGQSGLVASVVFAGSFGVFALLPLADRLGRRPVLAVTIAGYTVATFATAFSRGVVDFVAYQFVARFFLSAEYTLATIVMVETAQPERRGRALGLLTSTSALGQAGAGAGFLIVLAAHASWRLLYLVGIVPLVLVARARRDLPETAPPAADRHAALRAIRRKWAVGATALAFLFALFPTAVTTLASTLVLERWHLSVSDLRPWHFLVWLVAVSGFFVSGRLLDRWGRRPTSVLFLAAATGAGAFAFTASSTTARVLGLALVIFTLTGSTPCVAAYSTELFPPGARGRVGAWLRGMSITGQAAAPALTTVLAGPLGGLGVALAVVGSSYAVGAAVVFFLLPETRGWGRGPPPPTVGPVGPG